MIIHYIQHNFADWSRQTAHMSNLEVGIFTKLRSMYFTNATKANGKIDANDFEGLCYLLSCKTEEEISSLNRLLKYQFKKVGNTYRHADWDQQIKNLDWWYQNQGNKSSNGSNGGNAQGNELSNGGNETGNAMSNAERQAKAKQERKNILNALSSIGVNPDKNAPIATLRALFADNFGNGDIAKVVTEISEQVTPQGNTGNETGNEAGNEGSAEIPANNHKPITNNHKQNNKNKYVSEASEVFEFWKSVFEKSDSTIFSDKRKSKVIKRLEDGYTVEQIKQAIYNCSKSEYHISNNHTDLELICRDVEKIDRFLGLTKQIQQVNAHANHQPTYNQSAANQPVASHVSYGQNLMAELERELATQQSQHAFDDSYHGDVYDMETPV